MTHNSSYMLQDVVRYIIHSGVDLQPPPLPSKKKSADWILQHFMEMHYY